MVRTRKLGCRISESTMFIWKSSRQSFGRLEVIGSRSTHGRSVIIYHRSSGRPHPISTWALGIRSRHNLEESTVGGIRSFGGGPERHSGIAKYQTTPHKVHRKLTTKTPSTPNLAIQLEPTARGFLVVTLRLSTGTTRTILHQGDT